MTRRRMPTDEERARRQFMRRRRRADYNARRRAAKFTRELSDVDRLGILERGGRACYLCGEWLSVHEMTLDHVVPLARGGAHTPDNLRPAHRSRNSRKGSKSLSEIKPGGESGAA